MLRLYVCSRSGPVGGEEQPGHTAGLAGQLVADKALRHLGKRRKYIDVSSLAHRQLHQQSVSSRTGVEL